MVHVIHSIICTIIVTFFAWIGGLLMQLTKGLNPPEVFPRLKTRPLLKSFIIPTLIGQIFFGCLARNALYVYMDEYYDNTIADWCAMIANMVIFVRSGLELEFKNQGLVVFLLCAAPLYAEAIAVAIMTRILFPSFSWFLGLSLGCLLGANTPAIMVPVLIKLQELGYGVAKGIPVTLLAGSSIDDVVALPSFGIFAGLAFAAGGEGVQIDLMILEIVYQVLVGMISAFVLGSMLWFFRKCGMTCKFFVLSGTGLAMLVFFTLIHFEEAKYLGVIFLGYFAFRCWGEEKPDEELNVFWNVAKPFLYGATGAMIMIRDIQGALILKSLVIIIFGLFFRSVAVYLSMYDKKYNKWEKFYAIVAWLPKATVQAALGGYVLMKANDRNDAQMKEDGFVFLTICVISIIITAPPGAILMVTMAPKWLQKQERYLSSRLSKYGSRPSQKQSPYISVKGSKVASKQISKFHTLKDDGSEQNIRNNKPIKEDMMNYQIQEESCDQMSVFIEDNLMKNIIYDIFEAKRQKTLNDRDEVSSMDTEIEKLEDFEKIKKHPLYYDD